MNDFHIVVLGCMGGALESNLSGFLVATNDVSSFVALDAGSLLTGIEKAMERGNLSAVSSKEILVNHVKGYLISHSHLDHIAALVINSQVDEKKGIYALDETIDHLRDHIFNGQIWPNYGNEGDRAIGLYHYHRLTEGKESPIEGTAFQVAPFALTHGRQCGSTAFLLEAKGRYLLYFGDTASDGASKEKRLLPIWQRIAPLVDRGELKALLLECSYAHSEAEHAMHGHLDTHMMIEELRVLASFCHSLRSLKVIVTHRKQTFLKPDRVSLIEKELTQLNDVGVEFIFPTQGQKISV